MKKLIYAMMLTGITTAALAGKVASPAREEYHPENTLYGEYQRIQDALRTLTRKGQQDVRATHAVQDFKLSVERAEFVLPQDSVKQLRAVGLIGKKEQAISATEREAYNKYSLRS